MSESFASRASAIWVAFTSSLSTLTDGSDRVRSAVKNVAGAQVHRHVLRYGRGSSISAGRGKGFERIVQLLGVFLVLAVALGGLGAGLLIPAAGAAGGVARAGVKIFDALPSEFTAAPVSQQSKVLDARGNVIATPYEVNRVVVPLSGVSPVMRQAQVAIEDSRFYEHGAVDVHGVLRALVSNASGTSTQGGSTLTQQYVKVLLEETALSSGDKSTAAAAALRSGIAGVSRKLQELKYSIQLEKTMSKDQILEGYLNLVYYGDQAYGVEAAARHYFSKSAKELNLPEAALLAGLAQNPGTTDPVHHPDRALARRNVVLDRMGEVGLVTGKELETAIAVPITAMLHVTAAPSACSGSGDNAYFCDYVLKWLQTDSSLDVALGATVGERSKRLFNGLTIQTTLDPDITKTAREEILTKVPQNNDRSIGSATVIIDPRTGEVRGMAQNTTYGLKPQNRGETSVNWAVDTKYGGSIGFGFGSTEKAFALVTALEQGMPITATVDAKTAGPHQAATYTGADFPDACGLGRQTWSVRNDEFVPGGPMPLIHATARSINTAFVALVSHLGACNVRDTETKLGLHQSNGEPVKPFPAAITLGTDSVSPMTVASAYGTLGNEGIHCTPTPITAITTADGKALPVPKPGTSNCQQVVDPDVAHGVAAIMGGVLTGEGTAAASALANGRPAAGKTGTTDGNNETWFVGYTPQLTTAVWVGTPFDNTQVLDNVTLGGQFYPVVYGASIAAPIWKGIMDRVLDGQPNTPFPAPSDNVIRAITPFDVLGQSVADATNLLQGLGFTVTIGVSIPSTYPAGTVAATDPAGAAPQGSQVTLILSTDSAGHRPQPPPAPPQPPPAQPPTPPQPPRSQPPTPPQPPRSQSPARPQRPPAQPQLPRTQPAPLPTAPQPATPPNAPAPTALPPKPTSTTR